MKEKIYDNSNIAESYAGATTPLTFSFVRYVYEEVYQCFSRMMGANDRLIKENKFIFEHMIEFIGCRIYYNLNSWYRMLSFFPGYRFSGEFMERMMGVEKHNPTNMDSHYNFYQKYFFYFPKTILQAIRISITFLFLRWRMPKFNEHFDRVHSQVSLVDLNKLSLKKLQNSYTDIDDKLLSRWRVPIANDFAVMVSAGLADKLFKKWLNSDNAYSHMQPTANKPLISLDPGDMVMQIINLIKENEEISELFSEEHTEEIIKALNGKYANSRVAIKIDAYLKEFGARMPNELKLESETLIENPKSFIALIKASAQSKLENKGSTKVKFMEDSYKNLSFSKRVFLRWLLGWAGNSIHRREEARFRRALIFGYVRKIFLAIGKKLQQKQVIKSTRDIFYLSVEEIFNLIDAKKEDFDTLNAIKQQKRKLIKWQNLELPRRFETTESISEIEQQILEQSADSYKKFTGQLMGSVASRPNNIQNFSGTALTLKNFDPAADFEGKILVTLQTDPGWAMVFPLLKGIIVERGGMLSHAAIVARELNIPCIVNAQQATDLISSDTQITLNLQTGLIKEVC